MQEMTLLEWLIASPAVFATIVHNDGEMRRALENAVEENKKASNESLLQRRVFQDTIISALKEVADETAKRVSKELD